jgi:dihydropteroate synthase-like protein
VLSLDETSLDAVAGTGCVPILVPRPHGDLASLLRAIDKAEALGMPHIADPVLDPIHFGFMGSLERYAELRRRRPEAEILMGTGNLTELTDADSQGVTAMLLGICSELRIGNVLIVQVSPHTRRTVFEHDAARRLMYRAREDMSLPKGYGGGLLSLHDLRPFPLSAADIEEAARGTRDANFRIHAAEDGLHVFNRDGHHVSIDPFELFPKLGVEADGAHAFYLGYELAKAEIARALGKRYAQEAEGIEDVGWAARRERGGSPTSCGERTRKSLGFGRGRCPLTQPNLHR